MSHLSTNIIKTFIKMEILCLQHPSSFVLSRGETNFCFFLQWFMFRKAHIAPESIAPLFPLAPIRQMFIGFRLRARSFQIQRVFRALMGFLLHIWLFSSLCSNAALNECASPAGARRQWTLQLMYDNYIYFSLERRANKKHQQSQAAEAGEGANFRKIRRKFLFLYFYFSLPLPEQIFADEIKLPFFFSYSSFAPLLKQIWF